MAIYRNVKTAFWDDEKVIDEFSPEDKYFFLYLLTNPQATQIGIYKLVPKSTAFYMGYSKEAVMVLLDRFETKYNMIRYSRDTNEVAIKNYLRHSIIKGGKPVVDCLKKEEKSVKDKSLVQYIINSISDKEDLNSAVEEFIEYLIEEKGYSSRKESSKEKKLDEKDKREDKEKEGNVDVTWNVTWDVTSDDTSQPDVLFEMLWSIYPKKRGKGQVSKKAKQKIAEIGYEHMARAIERYSSEVAGKDQQYTMYGSTFFNSGYVDYLDENYKPLPTHTEQIADVFKRAGEKIDQEGGVYNEFPRI
jgi:hypothetical protein